MLTAIKKSIEDLVILINILNEISIGIAYRIKLRAFKINKLNKRKVFCTDVQ
jgi:hypothetical protein